MAYPFIQSPHVTRTDGRRIDLIVIHTMELDERRDTAERCAAWFTDPAAKVSAHYCVDADSIVQCVRDQDVAWHAPGANHNGIGIEHAGRAAQADRDWGDAYSTAMLDRSATLVAELCRRYEIPVAWLGAVELREGQRGVTTHKAVTDAFKRGGHGDPGQGFPAKRYLALVRARIGGAATSGEPPLLWRGSRGRQVERLQQFLRRHGLLSEPAKVDGVFGKLTEAAVKAFQERHGLAPDGIVGPLTWRALEAAGVGATARELEHA